MKNAEEHKKLLEQIAELERNSVNYFDVEKEFFLIDSNNLAEVKTQLYGYSIQATGIYEEDNLTEEAVAGLDGRGCYVYVENRGGQITIKQDLNGCWGIYLFRHGDYFALSNSFFRLVDHIKYRYPLTVNRDYCHCLMINDVSSHAYSETAVNEIQLIERNAIIHINIPGKILQTELIDYKEHSISVDSEEGITTLDSWVEFWSSVLRGVAQHTKFIQLSLSGGFDTRISLAVSLNSGIDLNELRIFSIKDDLHTYKEDYDIATRIAEHYGFELNQPLLTKNFLNYSPADIFNLNLYGSQTVHNLSKPWPLKNIDKVYVIEGSGGETIRGNWLRWGSLEKFLEIQQNMTKPYSREISLKLFDSVKSIIESAFSIIRDKYDINDSHSLWLAQYLYHDTRCRHHFGKGISCNYLKNTITLNSVFDPKIRTLRFNTFEYSDYQLLMALIFVRYASNLLKFPFEGKRSIAPETIAYAQKINERFPICHKKVDNLSGGGVFHLQPRDTKAEKILLSGKNNPAIPDGLPRACLKATFESSRTFGLFTSYFDEELYRYAANYYDTHVFGRERPMYAITGVVRVLEDVEISQQNRPLYQDMKHFLEQDFAIIYDDDAKLVRKFAKFFTARIDFTLVPTAETADFKILSVSDSEAKVNRANWLKQGIGYYVHSYAGRLAFTVKVITDGKFYSILRGVWVPTPEDKTKLIPYWIDYTKLVVNGKTIIDKLTPCWHNKPYNYALDVKAGEEIKVEVEWLPHRSDT